MQTRIQELEDDLRRFKQGQGNNANSSSSTMSTLSTKIQELQQLTSDLADAQSKLTTTTNRLQDATDLLSAYANLQYREWSSTNGLSVAANSYASTPASVRISSATGRLEVGFGGSMNSGNGYFLYSITGDSSGVVVARDAVRNSLAQRVGVTGGASFIGSSFNSLVVSVPKNETLTVSVEMFAVTDQTYFFGAKIQARVAP